MNWTPELDSLIRQGRRNGWTYLAISERLGLSKGQVIGRAERLGLLKNGTGAVLHGPRGWSEDPEKRRLAMEMRAAGQSYQAIGNVIGVSKNQISGVASREKWPAPEHRHAPKAARVEVVVAPVRTLPDLPSVAPVVFAAPVIEPPEVVMAKVLPPVPHGITRVTKTTCQYPIGEKPYQFCGRPVAWLLRKGEAVQAPYCERHCRSCYVNPVFAGGRAA